MKIKIPGHPLEGDTINQEKKIDMCTLAKDPKIAELHEIILLSPSLVNHPLHPLLNHSGVNLLSSPNALLLLFNN